ncbi:MAG: DUF302 domain-containing protein [Gammaproteobacteria bacterium]|nr:DUF302 domain-containing protein [Gammaproteobacteria bacterium]
MKGKTQLVIGFVLGLLVMAVLVWQLMPRMMFNVYKSPHNFDETVATLQANIGVKSDWKVLKFFDFKESIDKAGYGPMSRIGSFALCNPRYASRILEDDTNKKVTAMMPLGIGVYEDVEGNTYVSELNVELLGMMFGGTIAEVMSAAGTDLGDAVSMSTGTK